MKHITAATSISLLGVIAGCGSFDTEPRSALDQEVYAALAEGGVEPLDELLQDPAAVRLGQALFFDKILSGNRDISCATCHTPLAATADGLSLSIGTGGAGLAQARSAPFDDRGQPILIPRNAPDVAHRGGLKTMFWDGRVADNGDGTFTSPAGEALPDGMSSPLAVQAMFPVTSRDEMRGHPGENELADIDDDDLEGIWNGLMARVLAIEEYEDLFGEAYPEVNAADLTFAHAAEAIAAFEIDLASGVDSPFDQYLAGDDAALSSAAKRGALLYFGEAGCARCHGGSMLTDELFHNRAVPQLGPGKGDDPDGTGDFGRERVTQDSGERYHFRTPPLRNVAATGPWMHDGAYTTLEGAVRHCMDPVSGLLNYDPGQLTEMVRATYRPEHNDAILDYVDPDDVEAITLTDEQVADLLTFLNSLTATSLGELSIRGTPQQVPSGLPIGD